MTRAHDHRCGTGRAASARPAASACRPRCSSWGAWSSSAPPCCWWSCRRRPRRCGRGSRAWCTRSTTPTTPRPGCGSRSRPRGGCPPRATCRRAAGRRGRCSRWRGRARTSGRPLAPRSGGSASSRAATTAPSCRPRADPSESREELARLVAALLAAGAVGVVLAGLGAVWLTRRAVQPMVAALDLQRRFVADASHELRTPLTLLATRAQLLDRHMTADWGTAPPDRVQHDVDGLLADAAALTAVLDDMLAGRRRAVGGRGARRRRRARRRGGRRARAAATGRGVDITRQGATTLSRWPAPVSVRRAVTALVDNAIDHAAAASRWTSARSAARVLIQVRDDGPGMPPEGAEVFRRFALAPSRRRRHAPALRDRARAGRGGGSAARRLRDGRSARGRPAGCRDHAGAACSAVSSCAVGVDGEHRRRRRAATPRRRRRGRGPGRRWPARRRW